MKFKCANCGKVQERQSIIVKWCLWCKGNLRVKGAEKYGANRKVKKDNAKDKD